MFNKVQWRIALWFIGLSTAVYIVPTMLALMLFYVSLTTAIDRELKVFMASFGHAIKVINGEPVLRDWARIVQTDPAHSLVTYQLFDRNGKLLEEHGQPGIPILFKKSQEISNKVFSMRTCITPLTEGNTIVGYLQVQLSTKPRDDAMRELAFITALVAPVVLLGLGWSSYLVSEKAIVQIKQTNEMLRQFIADASHELYTPLSIAQAANESLARAVSPTGVGSSEFEISENALERMEKMLEDLTLLSTMESPAPSKTNTIISLSTLLEGMINEFRPKFERKNVDITLSLESDSSVHGDQIALQRMFANIVENALRYTDSGGSVGIRLTKEGHNVRIAISDTGIGIPKENLLHIFDRFYRVDTSRSRSSGGSGLGLSIALAIAQAHEGTIEAQSELGSGSTFSIILPAAASY